MSPRRFIAAVAASSAALGCVAAAHAAGPLSITADRTAISTQLGHKFTVSSTIAIRSSTPAKGLIAHLNVLSLRPGVYVDPEDWSSQRTRYVGAIPAGATRTITWHLQAVNAGEFGVYVAVIPRSDIPQPARTGPTVRVVVADRRTLNSGGIVPLTLGIPAFLALLAVGVRRRRAGRRP
jgi:hypothetical protein